MTQDRIIIPRPFEPHVHGRQGDILKTVAPMTARQFWGAIFEPNLQIPITTRALARRYKDEILVAAKDPVFSAFVLAYFTDTIDPDELSNGLRDGDIFGLKFYPKGATTNSENGITNVKDLWTPGTRQYDVLRALAANNAVTQLHCELNYSLEGNELDPYEKEAYFFCNVLPRIIDAHPHNTFSCEHLTSAEGADFIRCNGGNRLGCSITPHHLLFDRRDMFRGGLRPHLFCLPVIKHSRHMCALLNLIKTGLPWVYAGTDSAPHDRRKKECDCCSGGVFSAHAAVELYAMAFERMDALDKFEGFMSLNGPRFYGLSPSTNTMMLTRKSWTVDEMIPYSDDPEDIIRPLGYEADPKNRMPIEWRMLEQ